MIELTDIVKIYSAGMQPVYALRGITVKIRQGEYVAVMGASGSGKSTLMHIIGCLDTATTGQYILDGRQVQSLGQDELAGVRNQAIGFVFQQFNLLPRATALENVMLPLIYANVPLSERRERAEAVLRLVGLGDRVHHRPNQLSGGQQQRVSLARALVNKPKIILADEPTGALDSATSAEIMTLLAELHGEGITVILVTHESDIASYARRLIRIKDGQIVGDDSQGSVRM